MSRSAPAAASRIEGHEAPADANADVVHGRVRHDAAGAMVEDEPAHDLRLAAAGRVEVDGVAAGMPRGTATTDDDSAGSARRYDSHGAELPFDACQQIARSRRQAGT